jgi:iron complex transport system substrate-binding protein
MLKLRIAALAAVAAAALVPTAQAGVPARIVSLSPTATEDLFAIGAGPQVVAVDDQSNYPANAPRTSLSGFRPNAEAVATYKPDLVVVTFDGGIVAALQKLGLPVLFQPPARNLGEAYQQIVELGKATGHPTKAAAVVRSMQQGLTKALRSVPKAKRKLSVFHEISPDGYSSASSTFIGRVYKLFGFRNIADAADTTNSGFPQVSSEYVVAQNPQLIVLSDSKCCNQTPSTVASRPGWGSIDAVRNKRVVVVDDDIASRWGPRIVAFAKAVAAAARR